jgi:AcrR family transcriptional regulator
LYHYFDGKHAILLALLRQRISGLNLESKRVWCAGTLREALEAVAIEYFNVAQKVNVHEIFAIFLSESGKRKEVGELFRQVSEKYEADFLEGAIGPGLIHPEEEEKLKTALYPFFGALSRYNFDQILYGKVSVRMSQEKFGSYMAAVAVESLKCAVVH